MCFFLYFVEILYYNEVNNKILIGVLLMKKLKLDKAKKLVKAFVIAATLVACPQQAQAQSLLSKIADGIGRVTNVVSDASDRLAELDRALRNQEKAEERFIRLTNNIDKRTGGVVSGAVNLVKSKVHKSAANGQEYYVQPAPQQYQGQQQGYSQSGEVRQNNSGVREITLEELRAGASRQSTSQTRTAQSRQQSQSYSQSGKTGQSSGGQKKVTLADLRAGRSQSQSQTAKDVAMERAYQEYLRQVSGGR